MPKDIWEAAHKEAIDVIGIYNNKSFSDKTGEKIIIYIGSKKFINFLISIQKGKLQGNRYILTYNDIIESYDDVPLMIKSVAMSRFEEELKKYDIKTRIKY